MSIDPVSQARKRVIEARAILARQRALIEQIRARRGDLKDEEEFLVRLESSLRIFEEDLDRLGGVTPRGYASFDMRRIKGRRKRLDRADAIRVLGPIRSYCVAASHAMSAGV